jgi:DNA-directed RNA polymerase sigma subunit (sigma70/sigma32)
MAERKKRAGSGGEPRGSDPRARTPGRPSVGKKSEKKVVKKDAADEAEERLAQLAAPLRRVLQRLPETQRKVLELRMGLVDGHPQQPADAARTLGMSLGELREIEARAFERIREVIPLQQLQRFLER